MVVADVRPGEDLLPEFEAVGFVEAGDRHLVGEAFGEAELGADQSEEHAERHDEAREPGLLHDRPVDPADEHGEGERERHGEVKADAGVAQVGQVLGDHDDHDRGGARHGTRAQVELAADHQQGDRHGHDAEGGGYIEVVLGPGRRAEHSTDEPEEHPDPGGAHERTDLGSDEQALDRPAGTHAFIPRSADGPTARWQFGGVSIDRRGLGGVGHGSSPRSTIPQCG